MARYNYDVNTLTRYIDVHKQFSGGLKTVDTDDALGPIFLREAKNLSLSEFGFIEKRYGLIENLRFELGLIELQGYFEYVEKDQNVTRIIIGKDSNVANKPSKIYFAYSDGTYEEVNPEIDPLDTYSENFKNSEIVQNFEITHSDEIEAVRLGDILYIFTGVFPLVYSGKQFDEEFKVTYDYGVGSNLDPETVEYPAFTNLNEEDDYPPAPTGEDIIEGFVPFGWTPSEITSLSEDTTVTFEYTRDVKVINFYLDADLTELYTTRFVALGEDVTLPINPKKEGKGFIGWLPEDGESDFLNVQEDLNFFADFGDPVFEATIRYENSAFVDVIPLANGEQFSYDVLTNFEDELGEEQYIFDGFFVFDPDTGEEVGNALTLDNGVYNEVALNDLEFIVTNTVKAGYTVTIDYSAYDLNVSPTVEIVFEGDDFSFTVPDRNTYRFLRVVDDDDDGSTFTSSRNISISNVEKDYNLTALYNKTYVVTFRKGYGNNSILKRQTVDRGDNASAPSQPSRTGYLFDGWSRSFKNVTANITVTATWKTDPDYVPPQDFPENVSIQIVSTGETYIDWRVRNTTGVDNVDIIYGPENDKDQYRSNGLDDDEYTPTQRTSGLNDNQEYSFFAYAEKDGYNNSTQIEKTAETDEEIELDPRLRTPSVSVNTSETNSTTAAFTITNDPNQPVSSVQIKYEIREGSRYGSRVKNGTLLSVTPGQVWDVDEDGLTPGETYYLTNVYVEGTTGYRDSLDANVISVQLDDDGGGTDPDPTQTETPTVSLDYSSASGLSVFVRNNDSSTATMTYSGSATSIFENLPSTLGANGTYSDTASLVPTGTYSLTVTAQASGENASNSASDSENVN